MRLLLAALAALYARAIRLYLDLYRLGVRRATRLPCPVICIGNLTTGGTGKTPTTLAVCRMLAADGLRVAVLIRGYGGEFEYRCELASDGDTVLLTARQAGDEAYLLARALHGVPVAVGRDRIRSGRLLVERCHPDVIVMDDGMQHWRLHRDLDVVLLNARSPFDNGYTVPRGMLREPKENLARAGVVVLTNSDGCTPDELAALRYQIESLAPDKPIYAASLRPVGITSLSGGEPFGPEWLRGRRVGSLCALGNPDSFEAMLKDLGADLVLCSRFRDHHEFTADEVSATANRARSSGAEALLTTEKDAVKMGALSSAIPILILQVEMRIAEQDSFRLRLLSCVRPLEQARAAGVGTSDD